VDLAFRFGALRAALVCLIESPGEEGDWRTAVGCGIGLSIGNSETLPAVGGGGTM